VLKPNYSKYLLDNKLLASAVVLIDTREKENSHIIEWLDKKGIAHREQKLEWGDYSLLLPKNELFGIVQDVVIDYGVERKAHLEELSGNLTNDRDRIENELRRCEGKMDFVIENGSLSAIAKHEYKTDYNEKSFLATLFAFIHRYGVSFNFVEKQHSPQMIYNILHYKLREELI